MAKSITPFIIIMLLSYYSSGQLYIIPNKINDSTQVVQIAKNADLFLFNNSAFPPIVSYNKIKNEWKLVSSETNYTEIGDCKNTNGCTEVHYIVLILDAVAGTIKSKEEKTTLHANYE